MGKTLDLKGPYCKVFLKQLESSWALTTGPERDAAISMWIEYMAPMVSALDLIARGEKNPQEIAKVTLRELEFVE